MLGHGIRVVQGEPLLWGVLGWGVLGCHFFVHHHQQMYTQRVQRPTQHPAWRLILGGRFWRNLAVWYSAHLALVEMVFCVVVKENLCHRIVTWSLSAAFLCRLYALKMCNVDLQRRLAVDACTRSSCHTLVLEW
jgi:hypothetical protein